MASGGFQPSHLPPVIETGMRGFLKWYQREQPGDYPRVAAALWGTAPEVFSDYVQSRATMIRHNMGLKSLADRTYDPSLAGFLNGVGGFLNGLGYDASGGSNPGAGRAISLPSQLTALTEADLVPINVSADDSLLNAAWPTSISTADSANAGAGTSTATTSWLTNLIGSAGNFLLTKQQADTARAITNLQLQRAQQGASPLNISMGANGIPIFGSATSLGNMGLFGLAVGALALFLLLGGRRKAAA